MIYHYPPPHLQSLQYSLSPFYQRESSIQVQSDENRRILPPESFIPLLPEEVTYQGEDVEADPQQSYQLFGILHLFAHYLLLSSWDGS